MFCASEKDPPVVKTIPRYLNSLTISNLSPLQKNTIFQGSIPTFLNTMTLVFETFNVNFHLLQ